MKQVQVHHIYELANA